MKSYSEKMRRESQIHKDDKELFLTLLFDLHSVALKKKSLSNQYTFSRPLVLDALL